MRFSFDPGEAFQFDWSGYWAIICNERTRLQVAQTKLTELADLGSTAPTPLFAGEP